MIYISWYLISINVLSFLIMGYDKHLAKIQRYRISERALFMFSIFFGSLGGLLGMYIFHHKTKKKKFTIGFPLLLVIQFIIIFYIHS